MKAIRFLGSLAEHFGIWPFVAVAVLALIAYFGLIFGALTARAQHPGHAQHHDWYRQLLTPQGFSCCNGDTADKVGDCRPVQAEPRDDGSWWAFFGGRWQPVPPDRILADRLNRVPLHAHICEQDGYVRCFLKGGGGT